MKNTQIISNGDNIISHLSISKLKSFPKHPFKMYDNEKMLGLADSIKEQGVVVPILVRPIKDNKYEYEIIAGHNRVQASRLAGIDEIPCNIREMDDEISNYVNDRYQSPAARDYIAF